ncbi:unnamed protein product [Diabrotica balteata]|uniref:Tektin n=1 Tax=Diabrotica balteata TaxID=107213 RepID=A0A9N9SZQ2_DIABA|nr:unnamed protein product [Diabrotica balteata]
MNSLQRFNQRRQTNLYHQSLVVIPPPPSKFSLSEWHLNNIFRDRICLDQQKLADSVIAENDRAIDEVQDRTDLNKREVDHHLKEKLTDVEFIQSEIEKQRKEISAFYLSITNSFVVPIEFCYRPIFFERPNDRRLGGPPNERWKDDVEQICLEFRYNDAKWEHKILRDGGIVEGLRFRFSNVCKEEENLQTYMERIKDCLEACQKNGLEIVRKCIILREGRIGIDLCFDDVDKELRKELSVLDGGISLLQRTLEESNEQKRRIE